jgi:hypothetical protein
LIAHTPLEKIAFLFNNGRLIDLRAIDRHFVCLKIDPDAERFFLTGHIVLVYIKNMTQPIDPKVLDEAGEAYRVFMDEVKSIKLDLEALMRDIVSRVDRERLNELYKKIEAMKYDRSK